MNRIFSLSPTPARLSVEMERKESNIDIEYCVKSGRRGDSDVGHIGFTILHNHIQIDIVSRMDKWR